jgi:ABC-type transport system involved in multi-copper enzyme maturation permease subunit
LIYRNLNPIIISEMRSRMRGRRAFVALTLYLMLLSCLAGSVYSIIYSESISYYNSLSAPTIQYGPTIGKGIFIGTTLLLLSLTSFIAPGFAAGAIAGEREQQTYEVLVITPLSAFQIVWGKLGAVFGFLLLLILGSLPIQSMALLFGGVEPVEMVIAALGVLVTALAFGALGLYVSSLTRTTMVAVVINYGIGIPFIYGLPLILLYFGSAVIQLFNPLMQFEPILILLLIVLGYGIGLLLSINPFSSAILTGIVAADGNGYFVFSQTFGTVTLWFVSPWIIYVIFYTLLTILLIFLTVRRVAKMSDK